MRSCSTIWAYRSRFIEIGNGLLPTGLVAENEHFGPSIFPCVSYGSSDTKFTSHYALFLRIGDVRCRVCACLDICVRYVDVEASRFFGVS